ncbi:MAG TPA: ABC transporter permease/substrate-binding protein [Rhizomicrobium sp.]|jgi:osmoprotectant transport system permease protein|nr:ABC transporter permease/substrate-binding protein [Rhizomicrobium sp.]
MNATDSAISAAFARLPDYLGQHVLLSVSAILLGCLISLPLAVLGYRSAWLRGPLLGVAGIIQTIPGLALLALFYPLLLALTAFTERVFGFGFRALGFLPALLALTLYSMLPVLRNTIAGLAGIDPAIKTAARGVGMTPWQSLAMVEIPLAAPVIMAGVRTAAVWVIGMATLSTPVGQTSLGNYIFSGLQTENWVYVLFGCVAAAVLALAIDRLLALAEDGFAKRSRVRLIAAAAGLVLIVGGSLAPMMGHSKPAIVIGTKNFEEQYILGALIRDRLVQAGLGATERDDLGSTVIFNALAANDVDVYVDYSGTIWANAMKRTDMPGRAAVLTQMRDWLARTHGIADVGALGFENAYAFAMRADKAKALGIETLADLAKHSANLKAGGDYEFFERPEWASVKKAYGLGFGTQRQYQANFLYRAVVDGDVDVIVAFSSDGRIAQYGLKLLADPKGALPPYDAVLLVSPRHARDATLLKALQPLIGAIDLKTMQQANLMVDRPDNKKTPEQAARFLEGRLRK